MLDHIYTMWSKLMSQQWWSETGCLERKVGHSRVYRHDQLRKHSNWLIHFGRCCKHNKWNTQAHIQMNFYRLLLHEWFEMGEQWQCWERYKFYANCSRWFKQHVSVYYEIVQQNCFMKRYDTINGKKWKIK